MRVTFEDVEGNDRLRPISSEYVETTQGQFINH